MMSLVPLRFRGFSLGALLFSANAFAAWGIEGAYLRPFGDPAPQANANLVLEVNPYAAVDWTNDRQAKVNFHTHTTNSDGKISPPSVIDMYKAAGYDALAISDHEQTTWPWTAYDRNPEEIGMLAVIGNELSRQHHVLSLFSGYAPTSAYTLNGALTGVEATNGLAVMCHPALHWPTMYPISLQTPLSTSLKSVTRGDFAIETWFRTKKTGRNILMGNFSSGYLGALNLELNSANYVRVYLQPSSTNYPVTDLQVSAVTALGINTRNGQWHHLAATREGDVLSLYLNGILVAHTNGVSASFDLQGSVYYIGRDTRATDLNLDGDLDGPRLWNRALSSNEISLLAQGYSPGTNSGISRDGIVFEYNFETENGIPVQANAKATGCVDDTGGFSGGPFNALPSSFGGGTYVTNVPTALSDRGGSRRSLRLSPVHVCSNAVPYYVDLFTRYPHLFGIDVVNPTSNHGLDRELWDLLLNGLMPRRPIWGMGVDDMHFGTADFQAAWDVLLVPQLDENTAKQALQSGAYYFSTTLMYSGGPPNPAKAPKIDEIAHDPALGKITIRASVAGLPLPESAYVWISSGKTVYVGSTLKYKQVAGIGNYVRAEILGEGGKTFTNPFGFGLQTATLTGLVGSDKVYDGTTDAVVGGTPKLNGIIPPDDVTLEGVPTFAFVDPNVADNVEIQTTGYTLGGADAGKYVLTQPTLAARILKADQTIDFPAIGDKALGGWLKLSARASSGLAVSFNSNGSINFIDQTGRGLSLATAGEMSIVASQTGNRNWNPAPSVTNRFFVRQDLQNANFWIRGIKRENAQSFQVDITALPAGTDTNIFLMGAPALSMESQSFEFQPLQPGVDYEVDGQTVTMTSNALSTFQFFRIGTAPAK